MSVAFVTNQTGSMYKNIAKEFGEVSIAQTLWIGLLAILVERANSVGHNIFTLWIHVTL
jgi:hypothetical protein